jgi:hypothetical protein
MSRGRAMLYSVTIGLVLVSGFEDTCGTVWPEVAQNDRDERGGLAIEKLDEFGDDLIGRFFHEPVPGITNDHPLNILRHEPALLNQELA